MTILRCKGLLNRRLNLSFLITQRNPLGFSSTYPSIEEYSLRSTVEVLGKLISRALSNFQPASRVRCSVESVSSAASQHLVIASRSSALFQGRSTPSIASAPP